jgi:BRCT domain type II-containing protein
VQTEERFLAVKLTDSEWDERSEELASVNLEIDEVADRKKTVNQELKLEDDRLQARRKTLSSAVHSRTESRLVKCEWTKDFSRQMVYLIRTDTGEQIEQRAMTLRETQTELEV